MIQIYAPNNINYDTNGDAVLFPTLCDAQAELGGSWYLDMIHPIDEEGRWKHLVKEAVLAVPTFMGKKQLYRIDETDKQDTEITVKAYPIFFDSADELFLLDKRPTGKNGQEALDIMTEGSKYSGESNISAVNTAYFVRRNFMDCLNGESPSFIGIWGGEPIYDNYKVIVNERAGGDYGASVRYGMNMNGISFKEDMSEVVTRIVPVAYNGRTLSTNYVDSPLIQKYAKVYTREIKFEDVKFYEDLMEGEDTTGLIVCNSQEELDAALTEKCNEQFEAGIDLYKVTIDIDMVSIENTEEYKDFKDLVRIGLGDTVGCYNRRLGITTKARAIVLKWDCITDSAKEVTLGDYEYNVLDQWNSTVSKIENIVNSDGTVAAEKVQGILDAISVQLRYQKDAAHKQDVRAILFEDLDPESPMYGALAIGTQGFQISQTRTADGRDWEWTTAATAKGFIADAIIAGLLADKKGKSWWNLDTSELHVNGTLSQETSAGIKSIEIKNNQIKFYAWHDNGNYSGSIGAVKTGDKAGIAVWFEEEESFTLGPEIIDENGNGHVYPVIQVNGKTYDTDTPWIRNTASGKLFPNNPNGGIVIENGLIKDWNLSAVGDDILTVITGLVWDSTGITRVTSADIVIKNGLICGWTYKTGEF